MEEFKAHEVRNCFLILSKAKSPSDSVLAWTVLQKQYPHLSAMVSLEEYPKEAVPYSIKKYTKKPDKYLVPYFSSSNIYFLGDSLLTDMFSVDEAKIKVDYSLMFDTNLASYINKLARGEPLGNIQNQVVSLIDSILQDNLNFDHLFYMVENAKNVPLLDSNHHSKISFWRALNKDFRRNMVSLQVFSSIDCQEYKRTSFPKPQANYKEAARRAINFCYDFYASEIGKDHISEFFLLQRLLLLQLLGMLRIQLSTNKSVKNKMKDYFAFIHEEVGAYFDRESMIAHKYFSDRNEIEVLEKIKKGMCTTRLLKKLDNIAWDMAAPRFMEKLMSTGGQGDYFVPFFLTFDKGLRDLLSAYRVKGVIINKGKGQLIPIPEVSTYEYFVNQGFKDEIEYFFSDRVKNERLTRPKPNRTSIHEKIRNEYAALKRALTNQ